MASRLVFAAVTDTPAFNRPTTRRKPAPRSERRGSVSIDSGTAISASRNGNTNPDGRTPAILWPAPVSDTIRPTAAGSGPKRGHAMHGAAAALGGRATG